MSRISKLLPASVGALLFGALLLLSSPDARASEAQCCLRGTSSAVSAINSKGVDPDEKYFLVKGAPPNLMILLDTSGSMKDLPIASSKVNVIDNDDNQSNDWTDFSCDTEIPEYDAIATAGAFSMSKSYPPPDLGVAPCIAGATDCWSGDTGFPNLFQESKFYRYGDWTDSGATAYGNPLKVLSTDPVGACDYANNRWECRACVQAKGYWVDRTDKRRAVFSGKFLNFYPPKFVVARTVVKNVIWNIKEVRMGLTRFNTANTGGTLISGLNPPCDKSLDPDDASWTNNRKSLVNEMNNTSKVSFNGGTPLAEALLDVGQYFTTDDSVFNSWFGTGWYKNEFAGSSITSESRSVCYGCQISSVAVITDGAPSGDNCAPKQIRDQNVTCAGCDAMDTGCDGSCPGGGGNCSSTKNQLDDVAKWFWEHDLQTKSPSNGKWSADGKQRLATYTVGFGIDHDLLRNAAQVGGGQYYTANDRKSLEDALKAIIDNVNQRATSFGVSSISTLQTSSGMSTLVPRFIPGRTGEDWRGFLYRFQLGNELANGCKPTAAPATPDANDLNKDGDCNDIFYVDADGSIVEEDPTTGMFLKAGTDTTAKPLWEAGDKLKAKAPSSRNIWTVIDGNNDNRFDRQDDVIAFSPANADKLMPYMNISADISDDASCKALMTNFGYSSTTATSPPSGYSSWGHRCAAAVIDYYRGLRSFDIDPLKRTTARPWLLGDIFHSSPVVVEPPVSDQACFFFGGQCISSLFTYGGKISDDARAAYNDYVTSTSGPCAGGTACERRRSIVLVGSNGGFLHAFDAGKKTNDEPPLDRDPFTGRYKYDTGTGEELWAFIPPDLLGKLKGYTDGRHGYFVDGTPMVRDIWVDGDDISQGDGKKAAGEFRTVAIVGERTGGQHYFALDVTKDAAGVNKPAFLWMWPQPCDPIVQKVGESWSNFFPKPPPIVPVLFDASTTGYANGFDFQFRRFNSSANTWENQNVTAQERWIVALNGGHDPALSRGRGLAVVDAWNGKTYWSEFYEPNGTAMQQRMKYPFAAGVGMLDIGPGEMGNQDFFDGYFDSLTVGDLGGNLWVARLYEPGRLSSSGLVSNWVMARAFQTERDATTGMKNRRPISFITSNTLQPGTGYLRTFFGTGDRNQLLDLKGGTCSLDNLASCAIMGCKVEAAYDMRNIPSADQKIQTKWASYAITSAKAEGGTCYDTACYDTRRTLCDSTCSGTSCSGSSPCPTCGGKDACYALLKETVCATTCDNVCANTMLGYTAKVSDCPSTLVDGPDSLRREVRMECKQNAAGKLSCSLTTAENSNLEITWKPTSVPTTLHRFYGVHAFGAGSPQKIFSNATEAETFDSRRLTETNLANLGTLNVPTATTGKRDGAGWYISYDSVNERTASPAGVTFSQNLDSGCVIWNTVTPQSSSTVCAGSGAQIAHLIQADYVTGEANCGAGWNGQRYVSRAVIAPPPEPTPVVMLGSGGGAGGAVRYGVITAEPGNSPQATVTATDIDPVQSVYQLELTPTEHQCRHRAGGAACAP